MNRLQSILVLFCLLLSVVVVPAADPLTRRRLRTGRQFDPRGVASVGGTAHMDQQKLPVTERIFTAEMNPKARAIAERREENSKAVAAVASTVHSDHHDEAAHHMLFEHDVKDIPEVEHINI